MNQSPPYGISALHERKNLLYRIRTAIEFLFCQPKQSVTIDKRRVVTYSRRSHHDSSTCRASARCNSISNFKKPVFKKAKTYFWQTHTSHACTTVSLIYHLVSFSRSPLLLFSFISIFLAWSLEPTAFSHFRCITCILISINLNIY